MDHKMRSAIHDTWPCPANGVEESDLSERQSLSLLHLKLDVLGRESFQQSNEIREIKLDLSLVRNEVNRHGCRLGLTEVPAEITPKTVSETELKYVKY
jgi:hypothetical protein